MQQNIKPQYAGIFHFYKNIIQAVYDNPTFIAGLFNILVDTFRLVTNLYLSIFNYKIVLKNSCYSAYILFYKNEIKENKMYFINYYYHDSHPSF